MALPLGDNGRSAGAPSGRSGAGRRASVGTAGCSGGRPSAAGRPLEITRDDESAVSAAAGAGAEHGAAGSAGSAGSGSAAATCAGSGSAATGAGAAGDSGSAGVSGAAGGSVFGDGRRFGDRCGTSTSGAGAGERLGHRRLLGRRLRGVVDVLRSRLGRSCGLGGRLRIGSVVGLLLGRRLLGSRLLLGRRLLGRLRLLGLFVAGQPVTLGATGHHVGVRFGERGRRALGGNAEHTAEVEDLGVRHPELFRELVDPDLLRSHVVDSTFHSRLCLADARINAHPGVRLGRPDGRPVR